LKIVIFGSYGMLDIGDDAMLYCDVNYILNTIGIPLTEIRIITRNVKATVKYLQDLGVTESTCILESSEMMEDALDWCDKILITGGGTINTRGVVASLGRIYDFVMRCKRHNKKVFLSGQTIGPLGINEDQNNLARDLIDYCSIVTVRDFKRSLEYIKLIGADTKHVYQTVDDAWGLEGSGGITSYKINSMLDGGAVGFNANNYALTATKAYVDIAVQVCDTIIKKYDKNVIFIHQGLSLPYLDINVSKQIYERSKYKDRMLCEDFGSIGCREFKEIISRLDGLLASRYHSLIFAASSGVPYVGICADFYSWIKQIGFSEEIGMEDCIVKVEDVNVDNILSKVDLNRDFSNKLGLLDTHKNESMRLFAEFLNE